MDIGMYSIEKRIFETFKKVHIVHVRQEKLFFRIFLLVNLGISRKKIRVTVVLCLVSYLTIVNYYSERAIKTHLISSKTDI